MNIILIITNTKEKVGVLLGIVNIVIPANILAKTVANTSYSLLEYLHGMQGDSGSIPLGFIEIFFSYKLNTTNLNNKSISFDIAR